MREVKSVRPEDRKHFLVDINRVFRIFGKQYFIIFYFGKNLHPRQRQRAEHKPVGNRILLLLAMLLVAGIVWGGYELITHRLNSAPAAANGYHSLYNPNAPSSGV